MSEPSPKPGGGKLAQRSKRTVHVVDASLSAPMATSQIAAVSAILDDIAPELPQVAVLNKQDVVSEAAACRALCDLVAPAAPLRLGGCALLGERAPRLPPPLAAPRLQSRLCVGSSSRFHLLDSEHR